MISQSSGILLYCPWSLSAAPPPGHSSLQQDMHSHDGVRKRRKALDGKVLSIYRTFKIQYPNPFSIMDLNYFCKVQDSRYFCFCELYGFCHNYSTLTFSTKGTIDNTQTYGCICHPNHTLVTNRQQPKFDPQTMDY